MTRIFFVGATGTFNQRKYTWILIIHFGSVRQSPLSQSRWPSQARNKPQVKFTSPLRSVLQMSTRKTTRAEEQSLVQNGLRRFGSYPSASLLAYTHILPRRKPTI